MRIQATVERRRQPSSWPLWQLLLAVCLLASALSDVWRLGHLLVVKHVACPYDGVLVHEDELPREAKASSEHEARQLSVTPRHEHGDCASLGVMDRSVAPTAPVGSLAMRVGRETPAAVSSRPAVLARSVLSYAPKLPPPV